MGRQVGVVLALTSVALLALGRARARAAETPMEGMAATAQAARQEPPDAAGFLRALAGTPPVACELVLHSLENRWGVSSVRPHVNAPLGTAPAEQTLAETAWSRGFSGESASALLAGLESSDTCVRRVAARLLGRIPGPGVTGQLQERLRDPDVSTRWAAVVALAYAADTTAVAALETLLLEGDAPTRRAAAWALGTREARGAVEPLVQALQDADAGLRENAAWALGRLARREAVGPLSDALRDASPGVRLNAAWALGEIEDRAAIPALAALLGSDREEDVRRAAAWALGRIDG